jgi:uncharacterized protein YneF (UPF0154 family)
MTEQEIISKYNWGATDNGRVLHAVEENSSYTPCGISIFECDEITSKNVPLCKKCLAILMREEEEKLEEQRIKEQAESMIHQPIEGLLYDLNLLPECLAMPESFRNPRLIAEVITALHEEMGHSW